MVAVIAFLLMAMPVASVDRLRGIGSHYGPGNGVATPWCTWVRRHRVGCGQLAIRSHDTGRVVVAPVIDWCQCYRGTDDARIVDMEYGVVAALGLDLADGLYSVTIWRVRGGGLVSVPLPDTAMAR